MGLWTNESFYAQVKGKLIVSCQALPEEPLYSSFIMSRMAYAAMRGGAVGIRANTVEDIMEIRKTVNLPIIGIIKQVYGDCSVYITPTFAEIDALVNCGVEAIAIDATARPRPDGRLLHVFFPEVRQKYPDQIFMADCSSYDEGMEAARLGFDLIGTTMAGYTTYTKGISIPPFDMIEALVRDCGKPVIAEGNISTPAQLRHAMDLGVLSVVVGSAITRPMEITRQFTAVLDA